jgi:signal transduction histidine kinase
VNEVIRKCKPLFEEKNITLTVLIDSSIPVITIIPEDISDALFNLLVNSKNHTQEYGHVWLKIQLDNEQIRIIVEDDGSGIEQTLLSKIFEPFFTTRDEGHGLGLAIVKRTVKAHNGRIVAENRLPTGACFIMTLPFKQNE